MLANHILPKTIEHIRITSTNQDIKKFFANTNTNTNTVRKVVMLQVGEGCWWLVQSWFGQKSNSSASNRNAMMVNLKIFSKMQIQINANTDTDKCKYKYWKILIQIQKSNSLQIHVNANTNTYQCRYKCRKI